VVGPMARHVEDLNLALHALAGPDLLQRTAWRVEVAAAAPPPARRVSRRCYGHRRRYVGSTPVYPTSLISWIRLRGGVPIGADRDSTHAVVGLFVVARHWSAVVTFNPN
jgi:hypothetical protein